MSVDRDNWAGTVRYRAPRIVAPGTLAEAQRLVASSSKVRALGTRHSFNRLPDTEGVLLHLGELPADPVIDTGAMTVTVGGGTRYGVLARHLEERGLALHNLGSLPHISVAGAISTGTHGSGDRLGSLSSAVRGLQFIGPSGDLVDVRAGDPGFEGMVVGLGAFGPITRVTLAVQPSYRMRQDAYLNLPWQRLMDDLDGVTGAAYSVSLLTTWTAPAIQHVWVKSLLDQPIVTAEQLGAAPALRETPDNMNPFGVEGPWCACLPHFRLDRVPSLGAEIQTEYLLPRDRAVEALGTLREIGRLIDPVLEISELRTVAADGLWLSPAFGRDSLAIHFTFRRDPDGVAQVLPVIEARLLPLGARPHWGKLFDAGADALGPLYPRMDDWRDLQRAYDPEGKFGNRFIERHVTGPRSG
ncbi:MAG: FAD-binding protein [Micropruina sp.]|uniref:FAD-binding protein n=1 Tax=Micropruina sp. TaxID=2737536 RepID=UPI0039E3B212